jgi:hypothetical protein
MLTFASVDDIGIAVVAVIAVAQIASDPWFAEAVLALAYVGYLHRANERMLRAHISWTS